ncbi:MULTISPECIES: phage tail protein [Paenibacillus]|uniref:phage tail protein n=1 Tax=Paenibacillus TaxID=44249 RepID=UPI0022B8F76A|nr:phage tail protein [Paenibacillus caseinilyticus]MCZ8520130.1 phage tail protein [Paenibacillus caseinilyticus]
MITVSQEDLKRAGKTMADVERAMPKLYSAALNRTIQGMRTEAGRKVRETYDVKLSDVRPTLSIKRASPGDLVAILDSRGPNTPLIRFKTTPRKPPKRQPKVLKASVKRSGGKPIPGAFVTQVGGHIGVLKRKGKARLPIEELFGPPVPVMLREPGVKEHLEAEAERRMSQRLQHELKRLLGGDGK